MNQFFSILIKNIFHFLKVVKLKNKKQISTFIHLNNFK